MSYKAISFVEKLGLFREQWAPKVIAELNDYQFKLVKLEGDFIWHSHVETDEAFIVLDGEMSIQFRDGVVKLTAGEMFVVPRGKEHKPYSQSECSVLLVEPRGVVNTGEAGGEMTAPTNVRI